MNIKKQFLLITTILILVIGCKESTVETPTEPVTLRNVYKDAFYIGAALNRFQIDETDSIMAGIVGREFSSITAENEMKSMQIHPTKDTFNYEYPDKFVALGEKHNMFIHGHTLVWHSQLSPWIRNIEDSTEMAEALKSHITAVVSRYKGKIHSWDVVNEALNEDGTLRKSVFLEVMGEDYLPLAFKWTSEIDPDADLYYNDYNMANPEKRAGAIRLVKNIMDKGVKVDGIGMQGHWHLNTPSLEEIEKSIVDYASLGVKVAITELDISVLPNPRDLVGADIGQNFDNSELLNPYTKGLPDSIQVKLANRYTDIFKIFLKHKDKISRVTFWGVNDGQSWLNGFPVRGRTNHPLLFDRELKPKSAYDSIIALKQRDDKQSN
ncbi:endo-1,4-beta-xylanase [Confluentibacter flavum]|uniref:Beta-xylanase n=1 Tax=Confluentibacter flavum TaxID=1909700 RepID=A0A2N3HFQ4_9FLAO|nr:endo-1,4-beta-xylanase [Confluentibacter flavum]PKQ43714.1 1,4-beta-xylanase [Confluentibacter flavum]